MKTLIHQYIGDFLRHGAYQAALSTQRAISRRSLLLGGAATAASMALPLKTAGAREDEGQIAIIGAGLAGLTAAYRLVQAGIHPVIFEAGRRTGGRIHTKKNFNSDGMAAEFGGEFVGREDRALRGLCAELEVGLKPLRLREEGEELYFFGQEFFTGRDVWDSGNQTGAFRELAERLAIDQQLLLDEKGEWTQHARAMDRISLKDYLQRFERELPGWVLDLIEVACVSEFGLEAEEQSALNLIDMIETDLTEPFALFGESEAYRIAGGSVRVIDALRRAIFSQSTLRLGYQLRAISASTREIELVLRTPVGEETRTFETVILALPLTCLRRIEGVGELGLGERKLKAIAELGYGTGAKFLMGTETPLWRERPGQYPAASNGCFFSDAPLLPCVWETSHGQRGTQGILTALVGGKAGEKPVKDARQRVAKQLRGLVPNLDGAEMLQEFIGFYWAQFPLALGSYSCPKPGQYTTLLETLPRPELEDRLWLVGEHASPEYLSTMNGAVDSANKAARRIIGKLAPESLGKLL